MVDFITTILILIGLFLAYKLGRYIERNKLRENIEGQKAELNYLLQNRKQELNEHKEKVSRMYDGYKIKREQEFKEDGKKFKDNYRRFIAKKYQLKIPYEKTDFEKRWDKGLEFERYILKLFDKENWDILDYTKDTVKGTDRKIISSSNPDFVVRHIKIRKRFGIECKYRKNLFSNYKFNAEGIFIKKEHIKSYKKFARKYYPVFIVIGLGGMPYKPNQIFLIPLAKFKDSFISKNNLTKYERDINTNFIIKNKRLE